MKSLRRPDESAEVFLRRFAEAGFPENRFLLIAAAAIQAVQAA